ncbi:hypothetical protein DH2020_027610 [Rehmannia glutinosa]|uniref:STI1 domain-containing protein n=1 Tax=Rehmannia glutinosa TaxID=99300 RepID=A0ABR0VTQ6_REHGL
MDASSLKQLKEFVEQCKSNPSILSYPSLSFFRDYIESLGGKIPSPGEISKRYPQFPAGSKILKSHVADEGDEDMDDIEDEPQPPQEEEEPEIVESDVELDESDVVEPDNDPPQKMGDPSVEVSEENRDASQEAKMQAMEAISEGKLEEAIEHLTTAILLNPTSAIMYGTRASVYIKMKKPNAAIRDATAALEINPDSAKGYKSRGIARAMLGQWEEAAKDLHVASKIDYDEEIGAVLKKVGLMCDILIPEHIVEPNAHKIEEHRRKYDRLRKERADRKAERGMPGGFPGGMPGGFPGGMPGGFPGGMPGGFPGGMPGATPGVCLEDFLAACLVDPELMAAFSDPEVMAALQDVMKNPANLAKHQANPKVAPIIAKMMSKFAGPK